MTKVKPKPDNTDKKVDTRFKSGAEWTGNAAGRPPGSRNFTTMIREALEKVASGEGKEAVTYYDLLAKRVLKKMIEDGNERTITEFWRQHDGAPAQKVELSGGVATGKAFNAEQMARIAEEVLAKKKQ